MDRLPESLFTSEQTVIDWLADLAKHYTDMETSVTLGRENLAEHVERLLYFATGTQFDVRIKPTAHSLPRPRR